MTVSTTSVIIVSRERPAALIRCLTGLLQSDHPLFEVVVVADAAGFAAVAAEVAAARLPDQIKVARCDVANIAVARNTGLALAAGSVVAFIDDDAVPEPTWLSRLTAPFAQTDVVAAGGFVRARNGISYQWKARVIDRDARETPLAVPEGAPSLHRGTPDRAIKTEGTNCAFRRAVLAGIGGFDPAYAFYLDEADVNMRLAASGHVTAIVPGAEVHHGFAASTRRTPARVPRSLFDIGASTAVFLRRHGGDEARALGLMRQEQRARLLRLMVSGALVPGDVGRLLETLEAGVRDGANRAIAPLAPIAAADTFCALPGTGPRAGRVVAGRFWQGRALDKAARKAVAADEVVTVIRLSPTARPHRMRFDGAGYWEQAGGLFRASERDGPRFRFSRFQARVAQEVARLGAARPVGAPVGPSAS